MPEGLMYLILDLEPLLLPSVEKEGCREDEPGQPSSRRNLTAFDG